MLFCFFTRPLVPHPGNRPVSPSLILRYYRLIRTILAIGQRPALSIANMPMRTGRSRMHARVAFWGICFGLFCAIAPGKAGNLDDLLDQKNLTPGALARVAANFTFELSSQL